MCVGHFYFKNKSFTSKYSCQQMFACWAAGPRGLLLAAASSAPHSLASQRVQVSFSLVILGIRAWF
jgi:hypothetical protein